MLPIPVLAVHLRSGHVELLDDVADHVPGGFRPTVHAQPAEAAPPVGGAHQAVAVVVGEGPEVLEVLPADPREGDRGLSGARLDALIQPRIILVDAVNARRCQLLHHRHLQGLEVNAGERGPPRACVRVRRRVAELLEHSFPMRVEADLAGRVPPQVRLEGVGQRRSRQLHLAPGARWWARQGIAAEFHRRHLRRAVVGRPHAPLAPKLR
mmetsp:Transcript_28651/g.80541  ORF Transcript_28651/g.80541 Transcript_28651/m.80541 type:complete len:210 (-) Transcript_28651:1250-1879(-)